MKLPTTISFYLYKSPTNGVSINGFQLLSITQLLCLVFKQNTNTIKTSLILAFPGVCFVFNLDCNRLPVICTTLCYANDQHDSRQMSSVG